jgi:two-component system response regulator PilR (NtrC family)
MVEEEKFRQDLYYRINVINVHLPPLRERADDIPLLAEHFVAKFAKQMGKGIEGVSGDAMAILRGYHWPGNIRELENAMERAVALERAAIIMPESLSVIGTKGGADTPTAPQPQAPAGAEPAALLGTGFDLEQHVQEIEREYIAEALRRAGGVKVRAAELLGMSFRSFRYYTKKYNLK